MEMGRKFKSIYIQSFIAGLILSTLVYASEGTGKEPIVKIHKLKEGDPIKDHGLSFYPELAMTGKGHFYLCEAKADRIIVSKYDDKFKLIKSVFLSKVKYDIHTPHSLPIKNDEILIQDLVKNKKYPAVLWANETEPYHDLNYVHLDGDLNVIHSGKIKRMGWILKSPSEKRNYYYFFGNSIHLINVPRIIDDYLLAINWRGDILKRIKMKTKLSDQMIAENINSNSFAKYGTRYIVFTMKDLLDTRVDYTAFIRRRVPIDFNIYILDPDGRKITRLKNLTNEILKYFKVHTTNPDKKFVEDRSICLPLFSWDSIYVPEKNRFVFDIYYTFFDNNKKEIVEQYLCWYDIGTDKFTIIKHSGKYSGFYFFKGVKDNKCYFFCNRNYEMAAVRYDEN